MSPGKRAALLAGCALALGISPAVASAATVTVTSAADGAPANDAVCTLREKVRSI